MEKPKDNKKQIPEFELEVFEKSIKFFENSIELLQDKIKNHEYSVVVGDDTSGRLPALVIYGLLKRIYKKDGVNQPKILFLKGKRYFLDYKKREEWAQDLTKYLKGLKKEKVIKGREKTLLVTEYIQSNNTILNFMEPLYNGGLLYDVLSLSRNINAEYFRKGELEVYDGGILSNKSEEVPFFPEARLKLSGVKDSVDEKGLLAVKRNKNIKNISIARNDVKKMIDYLENYYYNLIK
jgi:hypothetical protein